MKRLVAALLFFAAAAAHAQYPQRPVQLIVPWGAGGGTDATARIIASLLERELKQPINVVNRTGGSGVVGHQAIASSPPDGYTLGMITVEITMMHWVGLTPLTYKDYTPVGLVNADPAGIHVRVDSPYKSTKELIAAIKATPGKMKASGTGQGGIWHLAIAGLLKDQRSEERRVGKEGRSRWSPYHLKKKEKQRSSAARRRVSIPTYLGTGWSSSPSCGSGPRPPVRQLCCYSGPAAQQVVTQGRHAAHAH